MAAALLSISSFLPSKNGDNYGLSGNLKKKSTSLYGQVLCSPNPTRMRINSIQRGRTAFFVASLHSLVGRKHRRKKLLFLIQITGSQSSFSVRLVA
ncbi:hypothetical protein LINPERPRIM_LOCUS780 [Linum perenne]